MDQNERFLKTLLEQSLSAHSSFRTRWEEFEPSVTGSVSPERAASILEELQHRLEDNYPFFHPRYAGQMLKPPHPIAIAAYMMAMQINPNNHALDGGPATAAMEMEAVAELAAMFGYTDHVGHLTSSGTIANLEALWVARSLHPKKKIAYSPNAHYTHGRMCEVLAVPSEVIDVTDLSAVERRLKSGEIGTLVVTLGTTGTGSVEPLHRILPVARQYGVRIHADCAYGGFFTLLAHSSQPTVMPEPFLALSHCDSIVVDPHKHGLQPYGCGCILFRDPSVGKFYKHDSPYTYFTSKDLHLGEISLECSRPGAAAAALWATLKALPLRPDQGFGPLLQRSRNAALVWNELMISTDILRPFCVPDLDIIIYFPVPNHFSAGRVSAASQALFSSLMHQDESPLYLAAYSVPSRRIQQQYPEFIPDQPNTTVLRSVLMKPEHDRFVTAMFGEITAAAESLLR